jgi:hypothetical protein
MDNVQEHNNCMLIWFTHVQISGSLSLVSMHALCDPVSEPFIDAVCLNFSPAHEYRMSVDHRI